MTLDAGELEQAARDETGLDDFGDDYYREGLVRLVDAMNREADLTDAGDMMQRIRLVSLLGVRLGVEAAYPRAPRNRGAGDRRAGVRDRPAPHRHHRAQPARGRRSAVPLAAAVGVGAPVPPPETATEHTDPRIAATEAGLAMMNEMFPLMQTMYHSEATTATECQDLMGMTFRTVHFDGSAYVPSYMNWVVDCDIRGTYQYHRRTLQLLQWHCPPRLWHLKTPVHMFALDALLDVYPDRAFLWSHRDPAKVLGSVCSLVHYSAAGARAQRRGGARLGDDRALVLAVELAMEFRGAGRRRSLRRHCLHRSPDRSGRARSSVRTRASVSACRWSSGPG